MKGMRVFQKYQRYFLSFSETTKRRGLLIAGLWEGTEGVHCLTGFTDHNTAGAALGPKQLDSPASLYLTTIFASFGAIMPSV